MNQRRSSLFIARTSKRGGLYETASYQHCAAAIRIWFCAGVRPTLRFFGRSRWARVAAAEFPERHVQPLNPGLSAVSTTVRSTTATPTFQLVDFHRERIEILATRRAAKPDLLAFETPPSLTEAEAIGEALAPWPNLAGGSILLPRRTARGSRRIARSAPPRWHASHRPLP